MNEETIKEVIAKFSSLSTGEQGVLLQYLNAVLDGRVKADFETMAMLDAPETRKRNI